MSHLQEDDQGQKPDFIVSLLFSSCVNSLPSGQMIMHVVTAVIFPHGKDRRSGSKGLV